VPICRRQGLLHQCVSASDKEAETGVPEQLDKDLAKTELLRSSGRARVLRRVTTTGRKKISKRRGLKYLFVGNPCVQTQTKLAFCMHN
jgi:hypothetical protein